MITKSVSIGAVFEPALSTLLLFMTLGLCTPESILIIFQFTLIIVAHLQDIIIYI